MDELTLQFFDAHPGALPLYEAFETRVTGPEDTDFFL